MEIDLEWKFAYKSITSSSKLETNATFSVLAQIEEVNPIVPFWVSIGPFSARMNNKDV